MLIHIPSPHRIRNIPSPPPVHPPGSLLSYAVVLSCTASTQRAAARAHVSYVLIHMPQHQRRPCTHRARHRPPGQTWTPRPWRRCTARGARRTGELQGEGRGREGNKDVKETGRPRWGDREEAQSASHQAAHAYPVTPYPMRPAVPRVAKLGLSCHDIGICWCVREWSGSTGGRAARALVAVQPAFPTPAAANPPHVVSRPAPAANPSSVSRSRTAPLHLLDSLRGVAWRTPLYTRRGMAPACRPPPGPRVPDPACSRPAPVPHTHAQVPRHASAPCRRRRRLPGPPCSSTSPSTHTLAASTPAKRRLSRPQ